MVYNGLEIRTDGTFTGCCITSKRYHNKEGKRFNVERDAIADVWNSEDRRNFIDNFDNEFETHCRQCADVEKVGGESKRLREIKYWKLRDDVTQLPIYTGDDLEFLDLKMGNTCNLACSICGPNASSKWSSIYKTLGIDAQKITQWQETDKFWNQFDDLISKVRRIELAGGEPFMIKKQEKLIKSLVERDLAKDIEITWFTNCTMWPENLIKYFKEFKLIRIMLSLDNTEKQFEYIRWPGNWDQAYSVFKKWNELSHSGIIDLGISHSIGMLNAWWLPEFHKWCREHKVKIFNNLVMSPMSSRDLPHEFKLKIKEKYSELCTDPEYQINPIIGADNWFTDFMMENNGDWERAIDYYKHTLLTTRNTELFNSAFPELRKYFNG